MGIKASPIQQITNDISFSTLEFTRFNKDYSDKRTYGLSCLVIMALFVICFNSCTNTASKLQGKWKLSDIVCDGDIIDNYTEEDIEVEFVGDSLQIFTDTYNMDKDTIRIKISGDLWMIFNQYKNRYDTIATIKSLSKEKIVLNIIDKFNEYRVITRTYEKITPPKDFSKEKKISQNKYWDNLIGEWEFTERYTYGEWTKYGEPVGWLFIFDKDGSGYQIRDNRVVTFKWIMPSSENRVILTDSNYSDICFLIIKMTKHTLHLKWEDEQYKLIRRK